MESFATYSAQSNGSDTHVKIRMSRRRKLFLMFLAVIIALGNVLAVVNYRDFEMKRYEKFAADISKNISSAVWGYEFEVIEEVLKDYAQWLRFSRVDLYENNNPVLFQWEETVLFQWFNSDVLELQQRWSWFLPLVRVEQAVSYQNQDIATLMFQYPSITAPFGLLVFLASCLVYGIIFAILSLRDRNLYLKNAMNELVKTQKKLLDSTKQILLGDVIVGLSHELNTPLGNAIVVQDVFSAATRFLEQETDQSNPAIQSAIKEMTETTPIFQDSLDRIRQILSRLKELEVLRKDIHMQEKKAEQMISDQVELVLANNPLCNMKIDTEIREEYREILLPGEFMVLLKELLENSCFHKGDKAEPHVVIQLFSKNNGRMVFRYFDNGPAIPADIAPRIFEPFITTARGSGAVGLGLYISHGITTMILNGQLTYTRTANNWNLFELHWEPQEWTKTGQSLHANGLS
ncbi:sensor histidine kinase [Salinispira pacifica]|uniref:Histidine kinase domain-containing protein n=1 Tax=Salinispira pacifica TaxID=1307761 RepID=V5WIV2_9SPIO|nr:HAMP domain-containing sensor histidine kinase [Salinispira pacifica]AHC15081.1 hypothetical protein L21SP2_1698 [Salinispira pacifica]